MNKKERILQKMTQAPEMTLTKAFALSYLDFGKFLAPYQPANRPAMAEGQSSVKVRLYSNAGYMPVPGTEIQLNRLFTLCADKAGTRVREFGLAPDALIISPDSDSPVQSHTGCQYIIDQSAIQIVHATSDGKSHNLQVFVGDPNAQVQEPEALIEWPLAIHLPYRSSTETNKEAAATHLNAADIITASRLDLTHIEGKGQNLYVNGKRIVQPDLTAQGQILTVPIYRGQDPKTGEAIVNKIDFVCENETAAIDKLRKLQVGTVNTSDTGLSLYP